MAKKTILLIDDEPELVQMVRLRLESNDYAVISALDGKEGMQKAMAEKPDLIILDILMPNKDGYTFLREAKADEILKKIPVIILTAKSGMKDLFALEGVNDYILKPFDTKELLNTIKKHI